MRDPYHPTYVEVLHDDGRWWPAQLLDQYRDRTNGAWRVVVTYVTEPVSTYIRALPADRCRRSPEQQDDQPDDARPRQTSPTVKTIRPGHSWRGRRAHGGTLEQMKVDRADAAVHRHGRAAGCSPP